jgi:hypothetical protein
MLCYPRQNEIFELRESNLPASRKARASEKPLQETQDDKTWEVVYKRCWDQQDYEDSERNQVWRISANRWHFGERREKHGTTTVR